MNFLLQKFEAYGVLPAIIHQQKTYSYRDLLHKYVQAENFIKKNGIRYGEVISLTSDFTPSTIALIIALINNNNIIVPFTYSDKASNTKSQIARIQKSIVVNIENDEYSLQEKKDGGEHELYSIIRKRIVSGLVLFTSGTSGFPKGAVHDFSKLLEKFKASRRALNTINFLLFDHWGGLNTMFHTLSNGGIVLTLKDRRPQSVCAFIEKYSIELLPASPTFLNLLLMSEEYRNYDLTSLQIISYGTEPMPFSTLKRLKKEFPTVKLQQTYGLIELGVLRSKSKSDDSLLIKIGGEGYQIRIVDNLLEIKAESAMLGYLNAPSPFTEDGWFKTNDEVEVEGEYIKILGRKSEIINVGGEKVYPAEVESVIQEINNVAEVTVYGEKSLIIGNIICAKIRLVKEEDKKVFITRLKNYCSLKMASFKVPVKVLIDKEKQFSERFKKRRV